jgi:hypothetical protein
MFGLKKWWDARKERKRKEEEEKQKKAAPGHCGCDHGGCDVELVEDVGPLFVDYPDAYDGAESSNYS